MIILFQDCRFEIRLLAASTEPARIAARHAAACQELVARKAVPKFML